MGKLVKLLGSGIGLASEAIAARKASSRNPSPASPSNGESSRAGAPREPYDDAPPQYVEVDDKQADQLIASGKAVPVDSKEKAALEDEDDDEDVTSEEGDEEQWDLDDAAEEQLSPAARAAEDQPQDANALADVFMRNHPPPPYINAVGKLPCPVILPQRRPRDKKRGFVRAYAPVLADCGIDQATFLDFLKTFHTSSKASPWLQVVNIAAAGAGMVPNPIAMGVSIAVQFAVGVAMEVQARTRTNSFLDRMNNEFFKPRGLYCLILTYKPEVSATHSSVDITQTIINYSSPAASKMKQGMRNMRLSSGATYGELEMPEAAPLIFPALDDLAASTSESAVQKTNKMKSMNKFIADYYDRRAQAQYIAQGAPAALSQMNSAEQKQFASRYADPNHPANSGSLISLITGGHVNPEAWRQKKRERREAWRGAKRMRKAERGGYEISPQRASGKRKEGLVRRMLKKDVLYLMIVNLPSEEEVSAGRESVRQER